MMKSAFIFLAFLGLSFGASIPARNLQDDLNDFLELIPVDEIVAIVTDYLANDAEVQEALAYLQSDDFHSIISQLEDDAEFKAAVDFLNEHGLDVTGYINQIHTLIGLPPYEGARSARRGEGLNGLIDDVIATLPLDKLKALFEEKLESSPDFKELYDAIRGDEFQALIQKLRDMPEYKDLLERLRSHGVDVDHYIEVIRGLFGITAPAARDLQDDLNDLIALLPVDEILAIVVDYLANDAEVQEAMAYLQSDSFHTIVTTLEGHEEFTHIVALVKENGLDITDYVTQINTLIGLPPYEGARSARRGEGLNGLIDDIIAILPLDELGALYKEKMETSESFQALVAEFNSPEFQGLLDDIQALPEFADLLDKLNELGVDYNKIIELAKDVLGLVDA